MTKLSLHNTDLVCESEHAGLALDKGLKKWEQDKTKRGNQFAEFIRNISSLSAAAIYTKAYERWQQLVEANDAMQSWEGDLVGRMFIGMGVANPLEASISIHRTYGTPFISGSAIKGLVRAYALNNGFFTKDVFDTLFGSVDEAGYLIFHDAWWVPEPGKKPYVAEIVTVHHSGYYTSKGKTAATDFDSPNPNNQIAARGKFMFTVEGSPTWGNMVMSLLKEGLCNDGIGAKRSSGYGVFKHDSNSLSSGPQVWKDACFQRFPNSGEFLITKSGSKENIKLKLSAAELTQMLGLPELTKGQLKKMNKGEAKGEVKVIAEGGIFKLDAVLAVVFL